jgi:thymidine phosphorylase
VTAGAPLMELHADEPERFERALEALDDGYDIGTAAPERQLVLDTIT